MFPKSNILHDPFSYTSQELLKQSYNTYVHHHQNPNSTSTIVVEEEKDDPFFLNFPSPFLDDHELPLSQIFSQKYHQKLEVSDNHECNNQADLDNTVKDNHNVDNSRSTRLNVKIMGDQSPNLAIKSPEMDTSSPSSKKRKLSTKPRRRTGKKDRHSKICTAQGVRDRRMRLSLQIARKFFDLQDMLGFDKASNTIEWLFSKSKNAIKELSRNIPKENNSSDNQNNDDHRKLRKIGSSDKPIRAKARNKTKEKMMIKLDHMDKKGNQKLDETNPIGIDKLGSNSKSLEHQFANVGIIERYLGGASYSSITSIFDYDNNGVIKGDRDISDNCYNMGILENCSMTNEVQMPFAGNNTSSIYLDNSRFHQF